MQAPPNGPRFLETPQFMLRRRPLIDPGLVALAGAFVALAFLMLMIGMLEVGFGVRLSDLAQP